jgi:hypothetical protein
LQRAVDRGGGRVELLGHLGRGEAEHLAQDKRRPLHPGQVLQRRDERELEALAAEVVRLGRDAGIGLEPADLGGRCAGRDVDGQLAPAALADLGEAPIGRDLVEPRADETAVVEAADAAPRAHERFLHRVLGGVQRAEHPVAVRLQFDPVGRHQLLKGAGVRRSARRKAARRTPSCAHLAGRDEFAHRPGFNR